jgi:hypothetical protein
VGIRKDHRGELEKSETRSRRVQKRLESVLGAFETLGSGKCRTQIEPPCNRRGLKEGDCWYITTSKARRKPQKGNTRCSDILSPSNCSALKKSARGTIPSRGRLSPLSNKACHSISDVGPGSKRSNRSTRAAVCAATKEGVDHRH